LTERGYDNPQEAGCERQRCVSFLSASTGPENVNGQLASGCQRNEGAIVHAQLQLGAWRHTHRIARIYGITDFELPALSTGLGRTLVETAYYDRSIPGRPEGWDRKKTQERGRDGGYDCSSSHEAIPHKTLSQSCR
jgi:hypothetical protein